MNYRRSIALLFPVLALLVTAALSLPRARGLPNQVDEGVTIARVSMRSAAQANGDSDAPALSTDGRLVVFASEASNLAQGDTNGYPDIFVHDRASGKTARVSINSRGVRGNGPSFDPAISADGRIIAFTSTATTFVAGDTNSVEDVFVRDLTMRTTMRVSVSSYGGEANGASGQAVLSADGRLVAFTSHATDLTPDDENGMADIFVHDRLAGLTMRVSVSTAGEAANWPSSHPALTPDGRYIAFQSSASNLAAGDENYAEDIFLHDLQAGTTTLISVAASGEQGDGPSTSPTLSADARLVVFQSWATNLVPGDTNRAADIFVHDRQTGATALVSAGLGGQPGNADSFEPAISADGRYVVFTSWASNLVPGDGNGDADIFVRDLAAGTTTRLSIGPGGAEANHVSAEPALSADGRLAAFDSFASNLVAGDNNNSRDIFVLQRDLPAPTATPAASETPAPSETPLATPSPTPEASETPSPTATATPTLLPTPSFTPGASGLWFYFPVVLGAPVE